MKISIITPSYNQEEFIERTIMSVLSQKWDFEIEYIIMDWWSTDKSVEIIKRIESDLKSWKIEKQCNDIDFIWKSEKDGGQSDAINKGLKISRWDILAYLNSDDTLEPWALQLVVNKLWKSDKKWSYWKCRIIDKEDKEIRKWITLYKNILWRKFSYSKLLTENFISQMTVFWKREVMEKCGYFDETNHLCMDYEYRLRIGEYYNPLYIPDYLANYRAYSTSKGWKYFKEQFKKELNVAEKYIKWKSRWLLLVHQLNYYKIVWIYKFLHFIGR